MKFPEIFFYVLKTFAIITSISIATASFTYQKWFEIHFMQDKIGQL